MENTDHNTGSGQNCNAVGTNPPKTHTSNYCMFQSGLGIQTYGTLMTCMMTWDAQGHDLMDKIHRAIMSN